MNTDDITLSENLTENEAELKRIFSNCSDFQVRNIKLFHTIPCSVIYLRVMIDSIQLNSTILEPLTKKSAVRYNSTSRIMESLKNNTVPVGQADIIANLQETARRIARGEVILLVEGSAEALSLKLENKKFNRQLEEPSSESLIRGPHIGFVENIDMNMAIIRRSMLIPELKMEEFIVGSVSRTKVAVAYLEHSAPADIVEEIKKRLRQIDIEVIQESG